MWSASPSPTFLGSSWKLVLLHQVEIPAGFRRGEALVGGGGGCFLAVNQVCCAPEAPKQFPPPAQGPPWLLLRNLAHHRHLLNVH